MNFSIRASPFRYSWKSLLVEAWFQHLWQSILRKSFWYCQIPCQILARLRIQSTLVLSGFWSLYYAREILIISSLWGLWGVVASFLHRTKAVSSKLRLVRESTECLSCRKLRSCCWLNFLQCIVNLHTFYKSLTNALYALLALGHMLTQCFFMMHLCIK